MRQFYGFKLIMYLFNNVRKQNNVITKYISVQGSNFIQQIRM